MACYARCGITILGVGYCLFEHGLPEPPADKRIAPHFFCIRVVRSVDQEFKLNMTTEEIRQFAYDVLYENYPTKMNAKHIANCIQTRYGLPVSALKVHRALRHFARSSKSFSIFPSFFPQKITYSVYPDEPFTSAIKTQGEVKKIDLTPINFSLEQIAKK